MSDAELERLVLSLSPGELAAVVNLVRALRRPTRRPPALHRASIELSLVAAPPLHLAALAAVAEALERSR